jgi:hypothetical protein
LLAVAGVHAPQAGESVQQLIAVRVAQPGALAFGENGRAALFVGAEIRDRMNQVLSVKVNQGVVLHDGFRGVILEPS